MKLSKSLISYPYAKSQNVNTELETTCEEPAPVSGEILDPPSFVFPLFPPLASPLPLQLRGSSCQPLADTPQRTQRFIELCKYIRSGSRFLFAFKTAD